MSAKTPMSVMSEQSLCVQARRQDTRGCGRGTPLRCSGLTEKRRRTQLSRLHDHAVPGLSAVRKVSVCLNRYRSR